MLVASKDIAYWVGRGDAEIGTGSPYQRLLLISLLCLALVMLYKRRFDLYKALKDNIWIVVLIFYMFASIFWTDMPYISLKRWVKELVAVVMAFLILSEANPCNVVESILRRTIYVLIPFSLLLVMFFPEHGTETFGSLDAWVGVTTQKNAFGRLCSISVFFLIWSFVSNRLGHSVPSHRYQTHVDILILGTALYLLKGPGMGKTISITSVATLVIGLTTLFALLWMKKLKRYPGIKTLRTIAVAGIVLGTAMVFIGGLAIGGDIVSSLGREETLTGRTAIWAELLPFAMKEPIIGHGIDGFFTDTMKKSLGNLPHSHNGYLEIILDYGFVGFFLFSMFLLSSFKKAYKKMFYDYAWGSLLLCFLYMTIIYNIAEPSMDSFTSHQLAVVLFLSVSSSVTFKEERL